MPFFEKSTKNFLISIDNSTMKYYNKITEKWGIGKSQSGFVVFRGEKQFSPLNLYFFRKRGAFMFIGTFEHNMDSKKRVFVPAKFREELGESFYYKLYQAQFDAVS